MVHNVLAAQKKLPKITLVTARAAWLSLSAFEQDSGGYPALWMTLGKHNDDETSELLHLNHICGVKHRSPCGGRQRGAGVGHGTD